MSDKDFNDFEKKYRKYYGVNESNNYKGDFNNENNESENNEKNVKNEHTKKVSINNNSINYQNSPYIKYKNVKNLNKNLYGNFFINKDLGKFKYFKGTQKEIEVVDSKKNNINQNYMFYPAKPKKVEVVKNNRKSPYQSNAIPKEKIVDNLKSETYESWAKKQINLNQLHSSKVKASQKIQDERTIVKKKFDYTNETKKNPKVETNVLKKKFKEKDKTRKKGASYTAIAICLMLIVFFGVLYVGNRLSGGKWFGQSDDTSPASFFAVGKKVYDKDTAESLANSIRTGGGAGYALKTDECFIVIAEIYNSNEDAKKVLNKEANKKIFDTIYKFNINSFNFSKVSNNMALVVKDGLQYFDIAFYKLYEMSRSIEMNEIDSVEAISRIQRIIDELLRKKKLYENNIQNRSENVLIKLNAQINSSISMLQNLTNNNIPRPNLVCDIRYTYILLLNTHIQLINSTF